MIFEDANALHQQLYSDLDSLIKIIKCEEQDYLEVNYVLASIFQSKQQFETNLFVDTDIANYRQLLKDIQLKQQGYCEEKKRIVEKYEKVESVEQSIAVLLKRVVSRVLEIMFSSINQLSLKPANSYQEYIRFKLICNKLLTQVNAQRPFKILKCINDYTTNKLTKSLMSLAILATNLENGKIQEIDKLKVSSALNKIQEKDIHIKPNKSHILENCNKVRSKIKENSPFFKEEAKFNEKGRFVSQRKGKKVIDSIKDVIQINRQDFLQDFTSYTQQDSKQKLLKALMARNKHNEKQISDFLMKKAHKRKLSLQYRINEPKNEAKEYYSKVEVAKVEQFHQSTSRTARKSLLLKIKDNQCRQGIITSQLYKKINKLQEYKSRLRLKSSYIASNVELKKKQVQNAGIYKKIQQIINENQELTLKTKEEAAENNQKLPVLCKRALSVDQNYKAQELQLASSYPKVLSNSTKLDDSSKKKWKGEKTQMLPSKIKLELKSLNNLISNELNKKVSKYDSLSRKLCF